MSSHPEPLIDVEPSRRIRSASALVHAALSADSDTSRLDRLVQAAATATRAVAGHLSMMTDRQVTAATSDTLAEVTERGQETPFEDTICAKVLRADTSLVITDATRDPRVSSVPAVAEGNVRAYLGIPLRTDVGDMVGVLCVFDEHPREWTRAEVDEISGIADEVMAELLRLDSLTDRPG